MPPRKSPVKSTPAKKAQTDQDLLASVTPKRSGRKLHFSTEEVETDQPQTPTPKRSHTKRKATVVSDNSDVEIVEAPGTKKKKTVAPAPDPDSQLSRLEALVFGDGNTTVLDNAIPDWPSSDEACEQSPVKGGKTVVAAGTSPQTGNTETVSSLRARSSRVKVPTMKAQLLDVIREHNASKNAKAETASLADVSDTSDIEEVLPVTPKRTATSAEIIGSTSMALFNGGLDSESDDDNVSPSKVSRKAKAEEPSSPLESDTGSVRSPSPGNHPVNALEVEDDLAVMNSSLQEDLLKATYDGLPFLPVFCDVQPFGYAAGEDSARANLSKLREVLAQASVRAILKGLLFVSSGNYVNMSRVDPNMLYVESNVIKLASTKKFAVGIMLGVVTECELVAEGTGGSPMFPYTVHRITIAPFTQEIRRDTSVWGRLLGFTTITGNVSELGISFHTRKKTASGYTSFESPRKATPKKIVSDMLTTVASPRSSTSRGGRRDTDLPSLGFDEPVPIYDGRSKSGPEFSFTTTDFDELTSLPLYKGGKKDLPIGRAVVAVGYTMGTYKSERTGAAFLSSNVRFVILLGIKLTD